MTKSIQTDEFEASNNQYVTFQVADEIFSFPMLRVLEIIRIPTTVAVPLTPPTLIGLANLRGGVLPIIDLRKLLEFPTEDFNESSRVVVVDTGSASGKVGLVVDRVLQVKSVDKSQIDTSSNIQSNLDEKVLDGVIKMGDGEPVIQLLNVAEVVKNDFQTMVQEHISDAQSSASLSVEQYNEDDEDDTSNQLVSFMLDEQEYAFDLMDVEEIVRIPDNIASMPKTDAHVVGLIELRNRLLPLISLRTLFGLAEAQLCENNRIVIVSITLANGQREFAGFIVDQVREVLRVNEDLLQAVPSILQNTEEDIDKICRLDKGKRLVSVLNSENVFGHQELRDAMTDSRVQENQMQDHDESQDFVDEDDDGTAQLVVFMLCEQEYAVSIDNVQEITRIPDKMDRVPKTPKFIEGVVNLRGTVLPVIDMRTRFELDKMDASERQRIIVLTIAGITTGFIVDSVAQVLRLPREQIEASPNLSEEQTRVMGKVVNLKDEKRIIQVLEPDQLLSTKEINAIENKVA
ncbi:chemotaxis protein CheW [Glaciecola sp. MH2013]|uniref:chemotaxis protein CheW n=1 Tax=Glaciecola sp. MH2013 TaxID=2785524 RepID=UPI00189C698A|nr:chemotaxis protein CheW [Glaciecola sp. MH2013]MBF7073185.1 chemotaxis protein CheW [Glaciecola sp. MH2013]